MNESQSVVGVICASYDQFFEAEKKIADCIKSRKEDVVDMTVAELAAASGTSDATVSRFCRRCGFKSFQNLKMALAREVLEERQKAIQVSNDIDRADKGQSLQNILANKVAELTETAKDLFGGYAVLRGGLRAGAPAFRAGGSGAGGGGGEHSPYGAGLRLQAEPAGDPGGVRDHLGGRDGPCF